MSSSDSLDSFVQNARRIYVTWASNAIFLPALDLVFEM